MTQRSTTSTTARKGDTLIPFAPDALPDDEGRRLGVLVSKEVIGVQKTYWLQRDDEPGLPSGKLPFANGLMVKSRTRPSTPWKAFQLAFFGTQVHGQGVSTGQAGNSDRPRTPKTKYSMTRKRISRTRGGSRGSECRGQKAQSTTVPRIRPGPPSLTLALRHGSARAPLSYPSRHQLAGSLSASGCPPWFRAGLFHFALSIESVILESLHRDEQICSALPLFPHPGLMQLISCFSSHYLPIC